MSSGTLTPPPSRTVHPARLPVRKHWTCDEFHQLGDEGWFEHSRPMLIRGEILEMPIPNPPHATAKSLVEEALRSILGKGLLIRTENPLVLGRSTDPVPDVAVVMGSARDYARSHPTSAELVVEVSDSSLDYDTYDKASLYASAGIADYWVVDLVHQRLIVHRNPVIDPAMPFGFTYADATIHISGQGASPLVMPGALVAVADLLS